MNSYAGLVYLRRWPIIGRVAYLMLKMLGIEIPRSVEIGHGFRLVHGGSGVVIHSMCKIGHSVHIYQGVTIGRADVYKPAHKSECAGIEIGDGSIIGAGAKVLCRKGILRLGAGTVVGANAVLFDSTGENEIWAGIPARCVGIRPLYTG